MWAPSSPVYPMPTQFRTLRLCTFALLPLAAGMAWADTVWRITHQGFGPVRVGMTVKQAERVLKHRLTLGDPLEDCRFAYYAKGRTKVSFMVEAGRITHAESVSSVQTASGVRQGDSLAKLGRLYGKRLQVEGHHYGDDTDWNAFVWEPGQRSGLRFEGGLGGVVQIYGGGPTIQRVEGCA